MGCKRKMKSKSLREQVRAALASTLFVELEEVWVDARGMWFFVELKGTYNGRSMWAVFGARNCPFMLS